MNPSETSQRPAVDKWLKYTLIGVWRQFFSPVRWFDQCQAILTSAAYLHCIINKTDKLLFLPPPGWNKHHDREEGKGLKGGGVIWRVCVGSEELEGKGKKKERESAPFSPSMNLGMAAENNEKTRQLPRILFPYPDIGNIFLHQPGFPPPTHTPPPPLPRRLSNSVLSRKAQQM